MEHHHLESEIIISKQPEHNTVFSHVPCNSGIITLLTGPNGIHFGMHYFILFLAFAKIGMFTIGGGQAMIPLIERDIVSRGWLEPDEFIDLLAVTQSLPGVFAVNIAIFVGHKIKGVWGAIWSALGCILPAFVTMLAIALFFRQYQESVWVIKIFHGIRPAVVALILVPCITAAKAMKLSRMELVFPALAALSIWLLGVSPVWIVCLGIAGGLLYPGWLKNRIRSKRRNR